MDPRRKRLIDARKAAAEGKRYHAFYRGCMDYRRGQSGNPFKPGSREAAGWDHGYAYGQSQRQDEASLPLCRLGPGGDFVNDWPEGTA